MVTMACVVLLTLSLRRWAQARSAAVGAGVTANNWSKPIMSDRQVAALIRQSLVQGRDTQLRNFPCDASQGSRLVCELPCMDDLGCSAARAVCEADSRCSLVVIGMPRPDWATLKSRHSGSVPTPAVRHSEVYANLSLVWRDCAPFAVESVSEAVHRLRSDHTSRSLLFSELGLDAARHVLVYTHVPKVAGSSAFTQLQLTLDEARISPHPSNLSGREEVALFPPRTCQPPGPTLTASSRGHKSSRRRSSGAPPPTRGASLLAELRALTAAHRSGSKAGSAQQRGQQSAPSRLPASPDNLDALLRVVRRDPLFFPLKCSPIPQAAMPQAGWAQSGNVVEHESYLLPGCAASDNRMGARGAPSCGARTCDCLRLIAIPLLRFIASIAIRL